MLKIAFKEWAVVCCALAEGRQSLILRKGGIAEVGGEFRPEHERFWLYPTYSHEHRDGVKPSAIPLFEKALPGRPPAGRVILSHFAHVAGVKRVADWRPVEALDDLHIWSTAAARAKFDYRTPGLFVITVRVYRLPKPIEMAETPAYSGCKTWVELDRDLTTEGAMPVLSDLEFDAVHKSVNQ
jgi:hypothetical protein